MGTVKFMSSVRRRPQLPGVSQLLLVLGLLVGVLLMHGVTADHDVAMASATTVSDTHIGTADGHGTAGDKAMAMSNYDSGAGAGMEIAAASTSSHLMLDMCLAILIGGGLLLPVLVSLRLKRRNQRHQSLASLSMAPRAAATRWLLAPSLTQLCVSRT